MHRDNGVLSNLFRDFFVHHRKFDAPPSILFGSFDPGAAMLFRNRNRNLSRKFKNKKVCK
jgi:hypothetical protein